jgi:phage-related minor tail protein
MSGAVADAFSQGISGMVQGTVTAQQALAGFFRSVSQSFLNMATEIIKAAIRMMAFNIISSLFAGAPKFSASNTTAPGLAGKLNVPGILPGISPAGALASGGTATGGKSYLVGEKGPELFTPGRTGSVTPNNAMGSANIVVNVDAANTNVQGNGDDQKRLGEAIGVAVRQELIKQKRPGGLLS